MQIVRSGEELAVAVAELKRSGSLALVPTMGALHAGHMALIDEARRRADAVAATIFVNPTQFAANEDLGRYPRRENDDAAMLEERGCTLLWLPGIDDIYPAGFATSINVSGVSRRWEGEVRSGHFDGVATIVAKLLLAVTPDIAVFGEKDFQQLVVVRRLVADLGLPAEIVGVPTVREADGLALSSRNAYLSADERQRAVALPRVLETARKAIAAGASIPRVLDDAKEMLADAGFSRVDYLALVDAATLEPTEDLSGPTRLVAAAVIGSTRLIDNLAL